MGIQGSDIGFILKFCSRDLLKENRFCSSLLNESFLLILYSAICDSFRNFSIVSLQLDAYKVNISFEVSFLFICLIKSSTLILYTDPFREVHLYVLDEINSS